MAADTRTNEQIVKDTLAGVRYADSRTQTRKLIAALAAAGRLVTPEHDAKVWDEGADAAWDGAVWVNKAIREYGRPSFVVNPYRDGEGS